MNPTPRPNPGALKAALTELDATAEALRALATSRTLRLLAGEGKYDRLSKDVRAAHVLMVRLEPLTDQVHAHSRLDAHWRTGRLDHRGLGPEPRSPESQARHLIRTLVWRSLPPKDRAELRAIFFNMSGPLAARISEPYRALIGGHWPTSMFGWMPMIADDPLLETTLERLSRALEQGERDVARTIGAQLAAATEQPAGPAGKTTDLSPRWSEILRACNVRHRVHGGQRLIDLMRRPLGPGAAHPAPDSHPGEQVWHPTTEWYHALNKQRARAGLRPYPRLGLSMPTAERA